MPRAVEPKRQKIALNPKRIGSSVTLSGGGKRCRFQSGKRAKNNAEPKMNRVQRHAGAGGRTRTGTPSLAVDFESTTSANSITPARTRSKAVFDYIAESPGLSSRKRAFHSARFYNKSERGIRSLLLLLHILPLFSAVHASEQSSIANLISRL